MYFLKVKLVEFIYISAGGYTLFVYIVTVHFSASSYFEHLCYTIKKQTCSVTVLGFHLFRWPVCFFLCQRPFLLLMLLLYIVIWVFALSV